MSLKEKYQKEIIPKLKKELGKDNDLAVPRVTKVVVNSGIGKAIENPAYIDEVSSDLSKIISQKPVVTLAKKSISGFKVRKGIAVGLKTTLRGKKMYDFLERLINLVLPRVRDFRGLPSKFDGRGNLSIGISEHTSFPEIKIEDVDKPFGLEITIVTSTDKDKEAKKLLEYLGFVFKKE